MYNPIQKKEFVKWIMIQILAFRWAFVLGWNIVWWIPEAHSQPTQLKDDVL